MEKTLFKVFENQPIDAVNRLYVENHFDIRDVFKFLINGPTKASIEETLDMAFHCGFNPHEVMDYSYEEYIDHVPVTLIGYALRHRRLDIIRPLVTIYGFVLPPESATIFVLGHSYTCWMSPKIRDGLRQLYTLGAPAIDIDWITITLKFDRDILHALFKVTCDCGVEGHCHIHHSQ